MMEMQIENQTEFEKAVKEFEEDYFNKFIESKEVAINLEKFYTKIRTDYNAKMDCLQKEYPLNSVQSFIQDWIYNNNSKKKFKTEFEILKIFCEKEKYDLQDTALVKAEFEAIQKVFAKIFYQNEDFKPDETLHEILLPKENDENFFCKEMPLKIPLEHFKVFTEKKSRNGNFFLTIDQFSLFIDKAFKGKANLEKVTLNLADREKLFIIKRFYEFYKIATDTKPGYEKTVQCKTKYINLISDNFTNWTYESLNNNFGNKVKREW